ncbi:CHAT domain-containing protein [Polynucleobacter sp. IMCC 29146]|uniref:CHAT domain-containing protein n=1 Tax=Polynucleobacter sp. IMCC 29146 TaxID=2780953 RepID=UPI001F1C3463|nr:CHAT domain-containing protein [Polynucleobacter sp. IMCC 29146]MCE7529010.1 CHAT domain-containing protein [Polynucleobacter sp. IMCC 29146]
MNMSLVRIALMSMMVGLSGIGFCLAQVNPPAGSEGDIELENVKAPPRNIQDILQVLDTSKQDFAAQDEAKKILASPKPESNDPKILNNFYYKQAKAFERFGNYRAAVAIYEKIITEYPLTGGAGADELTYYSLAEMRNGNPLKAIDLMQRAYAINFSIGNQRGFIPNNRILIQYFLTIGNLEAAKKTMGLLETQLEQLLANPKVRFVDKVRLEGQVETVRGSIFLREGRPIDAERRFRKAIKLTLDTIANYEGVTNELNSAERNAESARVIDAKSRLAELQNYLAMAFLNQHKFVDAEIMARESINTVISSFGVVAPEITSGLTTLANILLAQGRADEARILALESLRILTLGNSDDLSTRMIRQKNFLGQVLAAEGKYAEADKVYSNLLSNLQRDPELLIKFQPRNLSWVLAMLKTNKVAQATQMTDGLLKQAVGRMDKNSPSLAMTRAFHASALQADGKSSSAATEFKQAIPILVNQAQNDAENSTGSFTQTQRLNFVLSNYLALLAQSAKASPSQAGDAAAEAFQIADVARGSGVQRALTESAARASIKDPQLATLARQEQDLQRRINTLSDLLTGLLSAPANQQLPGVQAKLKTDIDTFKAQRDPIKKEIEKKFPEYAELVDPKPATVERTQKLLKPDEVLVSWYFADTVGYVWAISKDAPVQFVQLPIGRAQIAKEVAQLRKALDPGVSSVEEIPPFDVVLANQLYQQILAPVESALKGKKVLIVVPHAELGQLPLSVLVTKATTQPTKAGTPFAGYKTVPFLTKDIAIAQIPSVTALTALRSLPEGDPNRKSFVGFGDPYFSATQEKQADKGKGTQLATRGIPLALRSAPKTAGVSSAELALLPRLPDTSLEIEDIAKVVGAGPDDIFLHKQASVKQVMSMDLSNRKVVMFSTHGLVPGELNGLTQPALALSSPDVTGDKDDGLLTMDKVIGLKLNADWVVLSACNTAAGEGAASEAVSGLGRAFFFAGTKALLVSNWPVDSVASRQLMTDLFKRQQDNKTLAKPEALRQAMLAQIDQGGVKEGSTVKYSYAHPLFWAPFMVVGD